MRKKNLMNNRKVWRQIFCGGLIACMVLSFTACGSKSTDTETKEETEAISSGTTVTESTEISEIANDYYLDLTDIGMKLTIYLRLGEDGNFMLSNSLDFATNKGSGTFQKSDDAYVMIYDSLNGEEKTISDGITASFVVTEEGKLDFSVSNALPYGSANIYTVSPEDASMKLIAHVVTSK